VSRKNQISRKQQVKEKETKEEKDFAEFWKVRNRELQEMEERERQEELDRNRELEMFRKGQFEDKQRVREHEFRKEQRAATKAQALLDQQEKHFYSYAERCIKEWKDDGKNVTPLILELKQQAKRDKML
jgi:hypothetical protein